MNESLEKQSEFVARVEGATDPNAEPKTPEALAPELAAYERDASALLDSYRRFFQTFAKDVSLTFTVGEAFYIDLEKGEVSVNARWFAERGYTQEQILWAHLHELSHFRDLAEDTKGMEANFAYMKERARQTGSRIFEKRKAATKSGMTPENESAQRNISMDAAHQIHRTFYYVLDDIYVNAQVARRAPAYSAGSNGHVAVQKLYREKLFPGTDYRKLPRHLQFMYALLRGRMVPGEEVQVGDDARAALDAPLQFKGETLLPAEIVARFIEPRQLRDTKAASRYAVIRYTLEPIFEKLLLKDLEEWQPKPPQNPPAGGAGEGGNAEPSHEGQAGNPFDAEYKAFEKNSPDQLPDADIKRWLNKNKEDQEHKVADEKQRAKEAQKSPEQKAGESQARLDKQWSAKHGVQPESMSQFRRVEAEVSPYLDDLSRLWFRIIGEGGMKIERETAGYFTTGTELDIPEVIGKWPEISRGQAPEARVMKRQVSKEVLVRKPEEIRVRLVGDLSGSMDAAKKAVLQRCFVLILRSLQEFQAQLNAERVRAKTALRVDTEAWIFGSEAERIKQLRGDNSEDDEQVEIIRIFEHLNKDLGGTHDDKPLSAITRELTAEDATRIEDGKLIDIVFEITDGASSNPVATTLALNTLAQTGVVLRAFQIGKTGESEQATFNAIWNGGGQKFGEVVGEDIGNLLPAITAALKEQLQGVRI